MTCTCVCGRLNPNCPYTSKAQLAKWEKERPSVLEESIPCTCGAEYHEHTCDITRAMFRV